MLNLRISTSVERESGLDGTDGGLACPIIRGGGEILI